MSAERPPPPRALYLLAGGEQIFGVYHAPAGAARAAAVLICPPFGWEEVCSYRARREWAEDLAARGYPTLRIDLPGSGDSGGTGEDPKRLDAWTDAVCATAAWLREHAEAQWIAAIGIGLGGLLICRAAAMSAPIEEAVLWGTPARGRTLVRELRAFARLESAQVAVQGQPQSSPAGQHGIEAGGFALTAESVAELEALELARLPLSAAPLRRALLLGRDGIEAERRLSADLRESGLELAVDPGAGYAAMLAEPQQARAPTETFARVARWLDESPARGARAGAEARAAPKPDDCHRAGEAREIELTIEGARVGERPLQIEQPFGRLFGILSRAREDPSREGPAVLAAVLLNAGAMRRIGPNRMWVEIARRWAARGVPTLRIDLEGIGDADGDAGRFSELAELYVPELVEQVRAALDALERQGIADRFVLMGLCSGAYWSFHAALQDERVAAALMLNPQTLFWDASQETVRELRKALLRRSSWLRLLRGGSSIARVGALLRRIPAGIAVLARRRLAGRRAAAPGDEALQEAVGRLGRDGKRALFVFSGEEPLYEELDGGGGIERLERWAHVQLVRIPGRDHTLRPIAARRGACAALDAALERELERAGGGARGSARRAEVR
jgi:alpha-beta hydrolase superfamily lysophospholipase